MQVTQQRLTRCFATVFPELDSGAIPGASTATLTTWDSIAAIALMNVFKEEFGLQMDLDDLANLDSFEKLYSYLHSRFQVA